MKKLIASLLAAALLAAGLAGCGGAPASSGGAAASGAASASSGAADAGIAQQIVVARNKDAALVDPTQTSNATDLMTVAWNFEGLCFRPMTAPPSRALWPRAGTFPRTA